MPERSEWIVEAIKRFAAESPENALGTATGEPAWDEPRVGFAGGADPIFPFLQADIGAFLWTPADIFRLTFPRLDRPPEALSVISWILPQTEATRKDNRAARDLPAERWARSRVFGEAFNVKLAAHLVERLDARGFHAVAPSLLSPAWQWQTSPRYGFSSSWSERHAAYAAGHGTFGLCDGLITEAGKAVRCGSVVADIPLDPSPRPYRDPHAYCSFYAGGSCGKCIPRCPAGAISKQGHDKQKCMKFLFETVSPHIQSVFGFASYGCGLCQTGVPCEAGIPRQDKEVV